MTMGVISPAIDVFGFGMVLLELLTGAYVWVTLVLCQPEYIITWASNVGGLDPHT